MENLQKKIVGVFAANNFLKKSKKLADRSSKKIGLIIRRMLSFKRAKKE